MRDAETGEISGSYEFHSRAETVTQIRRSGNYFKPGQWCNSSKLGDMLTGAQKKLCIMQDRDLLAKVYSIRLI